MNEQDTNNATLMLRLPAELKFRLLRAAAINGRRITAEVNMRLQKSIEADDAATQPKPAPKPAPYLAPNAPTVLSTKDNGPAGALTDTDQAILELFRAYPVEKRLALLALLR